MEQPDSYDIELIERYINGDLIGDELNNFEARMKADQKLTEEVNKVGNLPGGLQVVEKNRLAKEVKKWMAAESEVEEPTPTKQKPAKQLYLRIMGVAAVAILFLLATGIFPLPFAGPNLGAQAQNLLDKHHRGPVVLRASSDDQWGQAIQSYNNGDFDQMIIYMKSIMESGNATAEQNFYFALAHLYAKPEQFDIALSYLKQTEDQDSKTYAEEIAWYRGLIFISREEEGKAKSELSKIISSGKYGENAIDLLKDLND